MTTLALPSDPETWEPRGTQAKAYSRLPREVVERANRIAVNRNQGAFNSAYAALILLRQNGLVGNLTQLQKHELFGDQISFVGDVPLPRNPFNETNSQRLAEAIALLEGTAQARELNREVIARSKIVEPEFYLEQTRLYAYHDEKNFDSIKKMLGIVKDSLHMVEMYDPETQCNILVSRDERYAASEIWYGGIGLGDGLSLKDFALHQYDTEAGFVAAVQSYFDRLTELPA